MGYPTARRVKHKLMQVIVEREAERTLQGEVVMDDAYLGGERRGKAGRGSENKVFFVEAVQVSAEVHPRSPASIRSPALPKRRSITVRSVI